jgi:hypothetical protein
VTRSYRNTWWKAHNEYDEEADEDDLDILETSTVSSWRQRSVENDFLSTFSDNIQ